MGQPAQLSTWSFACPDWETRLREARSLTPDLPLDRRAAEKAVLVFNNLRLPDVEGEPFLRDAGGEWQRDMVRAAFGSIDPQTGIRRVGKIFCMVPKKNSKTTGGAAIALTAFLLNKRPGAELQLIAPSLEIADTAFAAVAGMINADKAGYLQKRFDIKDWQKTIVDRNNKAKLKVKTFSKKITTGAKPVFVLLDELHEMAAIAGASKIFGQVQGNMMANKESLFVIITTQSDQPPAGVFKQELDYARAVRDGRETTEVTTLPLLYEFPEAIQTEEPRPGEPRTWEDPALWPMVLPNLGRSLSLDKLVPAFHEAKGKGEEEFRRWASQHLNIEIGLGLHANRWRGADYWLGATDRSITLETLISRSEVAVVGIDGGGLDDLLGLTVMGREKGSGRWLSWSRAWVQNDVLDNRKDISEKLRDLAKAKELVMFDLVPAEGDQDVFVQDLSEVCDIVQQLQAANLLPEQDAIGMDAANQLTFCDDLAKIGITEKQITGVPQGYKLLGAIITAERKLKSKVLMHAKQDLMVWCVGNAKAEQKGSAIYITKEVAGRAKIDPLAALFNAVELMGRNPVAAQAPRYQLIFA